MMFLYFNKSDEEMFCILDQRVREENDRADRLDPAFEPCIFIQKELWLLPILYAVIQLIVSAVPFLMSLKINNSDIQCPSKYICCFPNPNPQHHVDTNLINIFTEISELIFPISCEVSHLQVPILVFLSQIQEQMYIKSF